MESRTRCWPRQWLVWRSGNSTGHINKAKLCRAQIVLGLVTCGISVIYPGYSARLSLHGWAQWVQSDGFSHRLGRNGEFCTATA